MRKANGEGSVHYDRERRRWVGRVYVDGQRRKVTATTKVDVLAKMAALRHAEATGTVVADGNATVGDVIELWRTRVLDARTNLVPNSRNRYRWMLDLIDTELGRKRLRTLTVDDIEKALDNIATGSHGRGNPLARATLTKVRAVIITVLDFAVRRRLVASNPARFAELTATARQPKRRQSLTPDQAQVLWTGLEGERIGGLFRLQLATGLRPGEAAGLCWDAVDLDRAQLTVRRTLRMVDGNATLADAVKTASSYRTVGLPAIAVDVLRAQRRANVEARLAARDWAEGPDLVFPSPGGRLLDPGNTREELAAICKRLNLPVITPNELRHTAATVLSDAGLRLEDIADLLGHTSTRMLDLHYRHRVRPSVDAGVEVMGRLFGS